MHTPHLRPKPLTKRQREVLLLIANGNTQQQAAAWLGIRKGTVTEILTHAYRSLGVSSGPQAVAVALVTGELGGDQIILPTKPRKTP